MKLGKGWKRCCTKNPNIAQTAPGFQGYASDECLLVIQQEETRPKTANSTIVSAQHGVRLFWTCCSSWWHGSLCTRSHGTSRWTQPWTSTSHHTCGCYLSQSRMPLSSSMSSSSSRFRGWGSLGVTLRVAFVFECWGMPRLRGDNYDGALNAICCIASLATVAYVHTYGGNFRRNVCQNVGDFGVSHLGFFADLRICCFFWLGMCGMCVVFLGKEKRANYLGLPKLMIWLWWFCDLESYRYPECDQLNISSHREFLRISKPTGPPAPPRQNGFSKGVFSLLWC